MKAARMRGSSAAEKVVQVPPPEMPMQPTRFASRSLRVSIQSMVRMTSQTRQPIMVWPINSSVPATGWQAEVERAFFLVRVVAAAAEADGLDGHGGEAVLDGLDGEIVLVAVFVGAVAALVVDADDVVDAAAVAGHADHGGEGRAALEAG